ncbi:MAG: T9SS type A sorting domain-containing protein, partial [Bacteroidetes bacterium]|nr:T9SS type A sorting domain-containing protein [Bacteroidota bacterium]
MKKLFLIISVSLTTLVASSQNSVTLAPSHFTNSTQTITCNMSNPGDFTVYLFAGWGVPPQDFQFFDASWTQIAFTTFPKVIYIGSSTTIYIVKYPQTLTININISGVSVNENELSTNVFSVYPNPTTDFINIKGDLTDKNLEVYDITGKSLIKTTDKQINISELPAGTYFVKIGNSVRE